MLPPKATPYPASSRWDSDPVRVAEEEIRKYLLAHHVAAPPKPCKAHPVLCFLGIYAALALIAMLALWAVNGMDCDPLISDHGFSRVCRWGREAASITRMMPQPGREAGDF